MTKLREKMTDDLDLRNYADSTKAEYLRYAARFAKHYDKSPIYLGESQIRDYLLHLKRVEKVGPATLKGNVAALKFLYTFTLERPEEVVHIPWPKVPRPLPVILSGTEVESLLTSIHLFHHRAIAMTTYGTGLRIKEACSLEPRDIDSKRMLIHVREGKGRKERFVMLPQRLLLCLREYWRVARPGKDSKWLFPGQKEGHHISDGAVRDAIHAAVKRAGITKNVTPHVMRHSFSTHLLETGTDIRVIQMLLGHASIRTTERYTHVSRAHIGKVKSPLDMLNTEQGESLA